MKFGLIQTNRMVVFFVDVLLLSAAFYAAHLIRFDMDISPERMRLFAQTLPFVLIIHLFFFGYFDLYRGMWRYTSTSDLFNVMKAMTLAGLTVIVAILMIGDRFEGYSRSVFVIHWMLGMFLISGFRVGVRFYFEAENDGKSWSELFRMLSSGQIRPKRNGEAKRSKNLLIIGAGDAAEKMYREIRGNCHLNYRVVGFVDDNPVKIDKKIHGIPVFGPIEEIRRIVRQIRADELLIAIPSAKGGQMRRIVELCKKTGLTFKTVPNLGELIDGRMSVNAIREVDYRDLLGREEVRLDQEKIGAYLKDQCVLVTGAGGSIGSELCRQICRYRPKTLVLFEWGETPLYHIEMDLLKRFGNEIRIVPVLGNIQNMEQVTAVFDVWRPDTVFHAAAYKHVPLLEVQPWNPVKNNIFGTRNLVKAAREYRVKRFVFVSTDKAVRPTNVMGASKRIAEMIIQNQNMGPSGERPRFVSVRFGNVVGSSGSVIPLFKKQIEQGGPVTVTHPEVTRYFMLIPEACQLILQAGAMGHGGEIFILEMGKPVRIADMAKDLIRMSGFEPEKDIPIAYTGLRLGEKLYEELITEGEGIVPTNHEKIMVLKACPCNMNVLMPRIGELEEASEKQDAAAIRTIFRDIVPDYHCPEDFAKEAII